MSAGDEATNLGLDALRDRLSSLDRLNPVWKKPLSSQRASYLVVHPTYLG
jgi:hypothetical protein